MSRAHLWLLAGLLTAAGLALFLYKTVVLGFPLLPRDQVEVWTLQARFTIDASSGPVRVTLQIPDDPPGFEVMDEDFVSRGYGLRLQEGEGSRQAQWTIRQARGRQTLYYRVRVSPGSNGEEIAGRPEKPKPPQLEEPYRTALASLVEEVKAESADPASFAAGVLGRLQLREPGENVDLLLDRGRSSSLRAEVAVWALHGEGIPARVAYGLPLGQRRRYATFVPWLEVHDGRGWVFFDPATGEPGRPRDVLIWWRGEQPLIDVRGASNPEVEVSVWTDLLEALRVAERRADLRRSRLVEFSLLSLPVQTQAVYAVILLVPVGAFIMVLLRTVVGLKTFGTFMPVLIALAFRETRLFWGVLLFSLVVAVGLSIRFLLERLRLLLTPRLAVVLMMVVLILASISILSHKLGLETGLSVALFPLIILTMAIERMSIVWEERGPSEALQEGLGSLIVACLAYLVMNLDLVQHLVFVFPELLMVILAGTLLLGRYRGYRLLELFRFRALGGS